VPDPRWREHITQAEREATLVKVCVALLWPPLTPSLDVISYRAHARSRQSVP
jgi:hypothetical protein